MKGTLYRKKMGQYAKIVIVKEMQIRTVRSFF